MSEIDVVERVRRLTALFSQAASERGLTLEFRAESERGMADLDGRSLDRVVYNLIENAVAYTSAGRVEVSVEERERQVWIYVADTGRGIEREAMQHLFSPSKYGNPEVDTPSDETGLSITKRLVQEMGGRVVACSTKGEGSTFTVSFPALER